MYDFRFKRITNLVSRSVLNKIFNYDTLCYDFQETELVIPFFGIAEHDARNYLSLYTATKGISDLKSIMKTVKLFNSDYTFTIDQNLKAFIRNIDSRSFWTLIKNCNFPLVDLFNKRRLLYKGINLDVIDYDSGQCVDIDTLILKSKNNLILKTQQLEKIKKEGWGIIHDFKTGVIF